MSAIISSKEHMVKIWIFKSHVIFLSNCFFPSGSHLNRVCTSNCDNYISFPASFVFILPADAMSPSKKSIPGAAVMIDVAFGWLVQ